MSAATDLTAEQQKTIADAARILEERRDPRTPEQVKAEREAAEYAERIAQSEANFLRDPVAQAGAAEAARQAAENHRRELEHLRAMRNIDPRAIADERVARDRSDHSIWRCHECLAPTYTVKIVAQSLSLCERCWASHRLSCDACGNHKDALTDYCPPDGKWRCASCQETFKREYAANPDAFRNPRTVMAPSSLRVR